MRSIVSIQRHNGAVLGVVLWIPASVFERSIEPGQEEITVSFEENRIVLGKEEYPAVQAGREHLAGIHDKGILLSET